MKTLYILCPLILALTACGGSPSPMPEVVPSPELNLTSLQGIWRSAAGASSTLSAIVLPDGKLWAVVSNASSTRLLKASFEVRGNSFAASGNSFTLGTTATNTITLSASVLDKTSLNGALVSAGVSEPLSLAYQARYSTPAALSDFVGTWSATLGPGVVKWTLSDAGVLSGTRSTGCTYTGQLALRTEKTAVVNVAVTEDCAGAKTELTGVAIKTEDKQAITLLMTTSGDAAAVAMNLVK